MSLTKAALSPQLHIKTLSPVVWPRVWTHGPLHSNQMLNKLSHELKKWSSHLLDNLSNCLICAPKKFQVSSSGLKPITLAMPVQCSSHWAMKPLSCEQLNLLGSCVPVKGMMSERNLCEVWRRDELKKWSSHLLDSLSEFFICAGEKFQVFFNKASFAVYFTSSIIINFSFHSDLILENAKGKDVAFLVVGGPFGWVISEYHYSKDNGTILTVDTKILSPLWILIVSLRLHHRKVTLDNFNPQCGEHLISSQNLHSYIP